MDYIVANFHSHLLQLPTTNIYNQAPTIGRDHKGEQPKAYYPHHKEKQTNIIMKTFRDSLHLTRHHFKVALKNQDRGIINSTTTSTHIHVNL